MKAQEERKKKILEKEYNKNLVRKKTKSDYDECKFENYFSQRNGRPKTATNRLVD